MSICHTPGPAQDPELIRGAIRGDQEAAEKLLAPWRRPLFAYIYRMVTHRQDAEDLFQDVQIRVLKSLSKFRREASFKNWVFKIATHACLDHLRKRRRWRKETQLEAEDRCRADEDRFEEVRTILSGPDQIFEIQEHIAFCFSCLARTLEPQAQAALFLRDVFEFSGIEAARILGISEPRLRHRLAQARNTMQQSFDGLCQLVNKQGACWQCRAIREITPPANRGAALIQLEVPAKVEVTPETLFEARLEIVRRADLEEGSSRALHADFFDDLSRHEESFGKE